ncbi:GNAT family N-acetyltransferase [Dokdonella fugitiva]|jgi:predicted GNAT family N-acyltransferase|uniref:GNAT family N-acetyltransferase n=1 Tax=Dokdonella fugitiva TaxID=328517 RepID=UPI0015F7C32B|nr:GNAT family N-acetyltransferase [Dokdonella fugitiva]MBA8883862.1 putative GNAT family N-acyltransferase [Dokdonella fugitiva]
MNAPTIRDDFRVEPASWDADFDDLRSVREQVFVVEQAVPREDEIDEQDPKSRHVIARDADGRAIGTGRLTPAHAIGRVAVLVDWRGRGVGQAIMRVLLEQARALGYPAVELHSQAHAIPFYAALGFHAEGEPFIECGIPHQAMRLDLEAGAPREQRPLAPVPEARLLVVEDREQALAAVAELLADAKYELAIYTRDLDAALFDVAASLDAIKRVAMSGRHARIRILVQDPRKAVLDGHRLVALAQRLPSTIAIRTPVEEQDLQYPAAFLLNDRRGYLFRPLGNRLEGEGSTYAPGRHAQLVALFDQIWERSVPGEDLRVLAI